MHTYFSHEELVRGRIERDLEHAERRRLAKLVAGRSRVPSLGRWARAGAARFVFGAAFVLDRDESWRAVWDRMGGDARTGASADRGRR